MTTALYVTPLGFTDRRPAGLPAINRGALMRCAHQLAKRMRSNFATYREALAYGLSAFWQQVKATRTMQSLALQVAHPAAGYSAAQIEASRQATRRTGSSLWAS